MPSAVRDLFEAAQTEATECVLWGQPPALKVRGVYVVSRSEAVDDPGTPKAAAPVSLDRATELLAVRPELRLDGKRPSAVDLARRVAEFWAHDETVLYIGKAGTAINDYPVRDRVRAYYRTQLGARSPHAGGWFLKLLSILGDLYVHCAPARDPLVAEAAMLARYVESVSTVTRAAIRDGERPIPFANLEYPHGTKKRHGISRATG
jgi:hypothetical protein